MSSADAKSLTFGSYSVFLGIPYGGNVCLQSTSVLAVGDLWKAMRGSTLLKICEAASSFGLFHFSIRSCITVLSLKLGAER